MTCRNQARWRVELLDAAPESSLRRRCAAIPVVTRSDACRASGSESRSLSPPGTEDRHVCGDWYPFDLGCAM